MACVLKALGPAEGDSDLEDEEEAEEGLEQALLPVSSGASATPLRGTGRTFNHRLQVSRPRPTPHTSLH